jgi:glycerophosphoryl diester phosphodiesterase
MDAVLEIPPRSPFWVVGHRGSPLLEVENTLPSFEQALRQGANGVELDLSVTRDGEVVLWHDYDVGELKAFLRRRGLEPWVAYRPRAPADGRFRREVGELSLREFREHYGYAERRGGRRVNVEIPTLERFWAWASDRAELGIVFLDVKLPDRRTDLVPALLRRLDTLLAAWQPHFRFVLESCEEQIVRELKRLAPQHEIAYDVEPPPGIVFDPNGCSAVRKAIEHGLRRAMAQKPRKITWRPFRTHYRIVEQDLARMARHNAEHPEAAIEHLCCFTINHPAQMRALIDLGVSGIQSDAPALLRQVADARGMRVDLRQEAVSVGDLAAEPA